MKCLYCGIELNNNSKLCKEHKKYLKILRRFRYYKYKPRGFGIDIINNFFKTTNNIIVKAPRGVGKSVLVDLIALDQVIHNKDYFVLISSVSFDNAKEHIRRIRELIRDSILKYLVRDEERVDSISFRHNNSRILAIPQSEKTRVGYHPNLKIIDELARIKDSFYWSVLKPMGHGESRELIISTPNGARGLFRDLWDLGDYQKYNIKIEQCWWINKDYIEKAKSYMPDIFYRQEILGEFIDSDKVVFNTNLIQSIVSNYNLNNEAKEKCILALDFGRKHDYTAIVLLNYKGKIVFIDRIKESWNKQIEYINEIYKQFNIDEVIIDATGLGDVMLDNLSNLHPEPFIFTQSSKLNLINNLLVSFQNKQIAIHQNFKDLIKELEDYYWLDDRYNKASALRGHDDLVCALMLAAYKLNEIQNTKIEDIWRSRT